MVVILGQLKIIPMLSRDSSLTDTAQDGIIVVSKITRGKEHAMPSTPRKFSVVDFPLGDGIAVTLSDDHATATLSVDLTGAYGATASGANTTVAKTIKGAVDVPGMPGYKVSVMVYREPTAEEATEYAPVKQAAKAAAAAARAAARAA